MVPAGLRRVGSGRPHLCRLCAEPGPGDRQDGALDSARHRLADRARLRIRQRLPRHRQRRGHSHLHPIAPSRIRRHVVWRVQLPWRAHLKRRGGVRHPVAAAGRAHPAGRLVLRLRHGVRTAGRGDPVEPGHLVPRPAGVQLAHHGRLDHRRRPRQPVHGAGRKRDQRRRVGAGDQCRHVAAGLAACRLLRRRHPALCDEASGAQSGAL